MRDWKTLKLASLETMLVNTQGWLVMFHERLLPLMVVQVDEFGFENALFSDQLEKTELDLDSMARLETRMADFGAWYRGLRKMVQAQRLNPVWPFQSLEHAELVGLGSRCSGLVLTGARSLDGTCSHYSYPSIA